MFDILILMLLVVAFAGAAGYIRACAGLTQAPGNGVKERQ